MPATDRAGDATPEGVPPANTPLHGKRIAVTRPAEQAAGFADALRRHGAQAIAVPLIAIRDPANAAALQEAARNAADYDWVVFTSANAVERFWTAMEQVGSSASSLETVSICAVGPATAAAIEGRGGRVALMPSEFVGEAVVEALAARGVLNGSRILFARAEGARAVVPDGLRAHGAHVDEVEAYRTVADRSGAAEIRRLLRDRALDMVTFTSSSAVEAFVEGVRPEDCQATHIASIGPVTTSSVRGAGLRVDVEARPYTIEGLTEQIVRFYEEKD